MVLLFLFFLIVLGLKTPVSSTNCRQEVQPRPSAKAVMRHSGYLAVHAQLPKGYPGTGPVHWVLYWVLDCALYCALGTIPPGARKELFLRKIMVLSSRS